MPTKTKDMPAKTKEMSSPDKLMYRLLVQAETDFNNDRRSEKRFPFFRPVSVKVDGRNYSAFTREISASALGLMHNMELPEKQVEILVAGQRQTLSAQVERCEACGDGWYISGCKILGGNT
jgi:hypothetical protein